MQNSAAVLHGAKDLRIIEKQCPAPKAGEATVAVKATGLCGSDLHYYIHGRNGAFVLQSPMALGHEAAGEVVAVGEGVSDLKVGDRVAIEAGVNCRECEKCKKGRYNLCSNMRFCSSAKTYPHLDGTLQTYMNHPTRLLNKMPDDCSYEMGSLVEPLSVVLHAVRRSNFQGGSTVLVLGTGAVGLLACAVAKAHGASYIVGVDIEKTRTDFAVKEGFCTEAHVLPRLPRPDSQQAGLDQAKKTADEIIAQYARGADGFDVVMECTGVESCIQAAVYAARPGGKHLQIGMGTPNVFFPLGAAALREVDLVGVFRYNNTYPDALALIGSGRLPGIEKLVTQRFPLAKANDAFETLAKGNAEGKLVVKVMIGDYQ